ncbi:MAG: hypothetical protein KF825_12970 [Ferruginibacter sp.]|nr:hypothetical protein [Ferruginibacter sp.]
MQQKDISITVLIDEDRYELHTYEREYRNVMVLIQDNLCPDDFGECGGQGRCCTCLAEVLNKNIELPAPHGNEAATLAKHHVTGTSKRLSCHLLIDKKLNGLVIKLCRE